MCSGATRTARKGIDGVCLLWGVWPPDQPPWHDPMAFASQPLQLLEFAAQQPHHLCKIQGLQADATVVKTIMRANPGIMLLKDGVVVGKYHHNNTPEALEVLDLF